MRIVFGWFLLLILWLTWSPFTFQSDVSVLEWMPRRAWHDILGNVLLLAPIGAILALRFRQHAHPVVLAALCAAVISAVVETGQLFLPDRMVAGSDLALNTFGAALAGAAVLRWRLHPHRIATVSFVGAYALVLGFVCYSAITFQRGARIADWRSDFQIMAGNEIGADRKYQGNIGKAVICAGEGSERFCAGANATAAERSRLTELAQRTQTVSVQARVTSASSTQGGPTRIITFSHGAFDRNITLGQETRSLVLRIRTPMTGENGRDYEVVIPNQMMSGVTTDVEMTFARGVVYGSITKGGMTNRFSMSFDALAGAVLLSGPGSVSPDELQRVRIATAIVLVFPLLLLVAPAHHHLASVKRLRITGRRRALDPA